MGRMFSFAFLLSVVCGAAAAQKPPLLPEKDVAALAQELSGETAKRNLEGIARFHRQRGSQGFHSAAELVAERARAYGLSDVAILQFPADGKIYYGTQRSRPPWDAEFAELWEMKEGIFFLNDVIILEDKKVGDKIVTQGHWLENKSNGKHPWKPAVKIASYEAEPVTLAEDSESADVTAELIDGGDGTKESDYAGKDVKGKIVLAAAQPGAVQDMAIGKFGAAGIVSYAQNQKTAWSGEDENLIRWGHLETFSPNKTFGFMVSLKTGRALRDRLAKGEHIQLHATVKAGQHTGFTEVVTAAIPGADPKLKDEEIAFSCHLDHQRPGANDNASGCVTILEVARSLQKLIDEGKLARPARTLRFIWPPEIEGTLTLLNVSRELLAADQSGCAHGHGWRRAGDKIGVSRDARADELAFVRPRCGVGVRRIRQRAIVQLRRRASGGISVGRARRRQRAIARARHVLHDGQRSRCVSGQFVQDPCDLSE